MKEKLYTSLVPVESYSADEKEQQEELKHSKQLSEFAAYRTAVKELPCNPSFHFYAPDGMINDPNGLCYWKGKYHLFYQAYPPADPRQHWGHAYSEDLVHWHDLPLAIYPDLEYAVFSGATLVEEDRVIALYYGVKQGLMLATSSDPMLLNWEKCECNPVVPSPVDEIETNSHPYSIYDPFIWKDESGYYALSGTLYGNPQQRGRCHTNRMVEQLFHSQDLKHWAYMGELAPEGFPQVELGNDGACPYFLPLGDRYVLFVFSHYSACIAIIGDYDKVTHRFKADKTKRFNYGPVACSGLHAPSAMVDGKGGVYLIFNTKDSDGTLKRNGAMSVIYHVTLDEQGDMRLSPVEALKTLREKETDISNMVLPAFEEQKLDVHGSALDISMTLKRGTARAVKIELLKSQNGQEHTDVVLHMPTLRDPFIGYLTLDTTNASLSTHLQSRIPENKRYPLELDEDIHVRILLDKCMLEVFVNDRIVSMQSTYPTLEDSDGVSMTAVGGEALVSEGKIWHMKGIY